MWLLCPDLSHENNLIKGLTIIKYVAILYSWLAIGASRNELGD